MTGRDIRVKLPRYKRGIRRLFQTLLSPPVQLLTVTLSVFAFFFIGLFIELFATERFSTEEWVSLYDAEHGAP